MSFLNNIISAIVKVVSLVKKKKKASEIIFELVTLLPEAVLSAIAYGEIDSVQKLEDALQTLDMRTGIDEGAISLIRDLPADKEEELFDAVATIAEILGKNKLKVEGFYVEGE